MRILVPIDLSQPFDLQDLLAIVASRLSGDLYLFAAINPDRGRSTFSHEVIDAPLPAGDATGGLIRPNFARLSDSPAGPPVETRGQALSRARAAAYEQLQLIADHLGERNVTVDVAAHARPAEAIAAYAAEQSIDLLLMRTHGRAGVRRAVLGSVAEDVVRRVAVPVMLVGPACTTVAPTYDDMIICLDGTAVAEEILPLARWVRGVDLHVTAVTAVPAGHQGADVQAKAAYIERVGLSLRGEGVRADWAVIPGANPAAAITDFAAARPTSIVALITRGRTGLPRLLAGSAAMQVVHDATSPVLVVHAHGGAMPIQAPAARAEGR
jgi:nucleotide-binding universal stress UspA family protein